jgi:DNA-binding NtrC family response regulator
LKLKRLLVVDDVPQVKDLLVEALKTEFDVTATGSPDEALELVKNNNFDLLITDMAMPGLSGEDLIREVRRLGKEMEIIIITAYGSIEKATRLMRMGVYDYIEKPFTIDKIRHTIAQAFKFSDLKKENKTLQRKMLYYEKVHALIGTSKPMQDVREKIKLIAPTRATVLITGESGTGKEVIAREIHKLSERRDKPFIKINCASIPETLLESELFGHEKGAFTGALRTVPGKFELANTGTILLDEIGEMSGTIQAKLLRVLQEGEFDRVGGTKPIKVDVRIIATTNRNLRKEIAKGNFRDDLFYRLNVVPLEVPPLRDRREDIPLLVKHFIEVFSRENGRDPVKLSNKAMERLMHAYWRGNVRELENIIERAIILANGAPIDESFFSFEDEKDEQMSRLGHTFKYGSIREMEKLMILDRLAEHADNRTRAAKSLDISVRTLRNKLNEYRNERKREIDTMEPVATL